MTYNYLLTEEDIDQTTFVYNPSKIKLKYYANSAKIATLLILSDNIQKVMKDLSSDDLFEEMGSMSYFTVDLKIQDMEKYSLEILKEQSIIAGVSNWEGYFSDICEFILNDNDFIHKIFKDKEKLRKFLKKFNLFHDFNIEFLLNENKINDLKFGTYLKNNKKINFQNLEHSKIFLDLFNINLPKIDEHNWTEITQFFKDRHAIIHDPNNQSIVDNYSKDKIEVIIKSISKIIDKIDEILCNQYTSLGFTVI